jgi:phosphatidylglycerophosphate synthase
MDGYYARLYNMRSTFGSYYDSISDNLVVLILFYLFIFNKNFIKTKINIKILIIILISLFVIVDMYHMSCQEKYTKVTNEKNKSEGLSFLDSIKCNNYDDMKYTRYFGTGVLNILFTLIIISHIFFTKK